MNLEQHLDQSIRRLAAQSRLVAERARVPAVVAEPLADPELSTWVDDHTSLAELLTGEITSLSTTLDQISVSAGQVDDLQHDAITQSTAIADEQVRATAELALARDRLLQVAVAAEQAEALEHRIANRISTIRRLLG